MSSEKGTPVAGELCVICEEGYGIHETDAWNGQPSPVCDACIGPRGPGEGGRPLRGILVLHTLASAAVGVGLLQMLLSDWPGWLVGVLGTVQGALVGKIWWDNGRLWRAWWRGR
jgi:hypothetical protein